MRILYDEATQISIPRYNFNQVTLYLLDHALHREGIEINEGKMISSDSVLIINCFQSGQKFTDINKGFFSIC